MWKVSIQLTSHFPATMRFLEVDIVYNDLDDLFTTLRTEMERAVIETARNGMTTELPPLSLSVGLRYLPPS